MTDATLSARLDTADAERRARELADELRKLGRAGHEMEDGLDGAGDASKRAGTEFEALKRTVGAVLTLETARRVAVATAEFVNLGAAVNETASKYETVLGPAVGATNAFLEDFAVRAGLSNSAAQDLIATTAAVAQGMGFAQVESGRFAEEVVRLSADLGSFNNLPTEDVANRITSALAGERESLKALGIVVREADVQQRALADSGKSVVSALTDQERAAATLAVITERAGTAVGDLDRTESSLANQTRAAAAEFANLREELAASAAEGVEASGVMKELRDVLEEIGTGDGSLVAAYFRDVADEAAGMFQEIEVGIIKVRGLRNALDALFSARGVRGFRDEVQKTFDEVEEANREFELSRRELSDHDREIIGLLEGRAEAEREAADEARKAEEERRRAVEAERRAVEELAEAWRRAREESRLLNEGVTVTVDARNPAAGARVPGGGTAPHLRQIEEALEGVELSARDAAAWTEYLTATYDELGNRSETLQQALMNVGRLFGDVGEGIGGLVAQLVDANTELSQVAAGGIVSSAVGIFTAGIGNFIEDAKEERRRREELRRAQEEFGKALDDFIDELTDRTRYEQLRRNAIDRAQDLVDQFSEAFADVLGGPLTLPVTDSPTEFFENLPAGQPYWTEEMQAAWERIVAGIEADFARIEEARKEQAQALRDNIAIRELEAQGLDDEADALRLQLERQEELARARELEDEALVALLEGLYELEDAALAAAEAAKNAATAQSFRDDLRVRGASSDAEALLIRTEIKQAEELAAALKLLEEGIITQEDFDTLVKILGDEFQDVLDQIADSAADAAEAMREQLEAQREATRAAEEDLEIRKLLVQGLDDEAAIMRLQIKQRDEYNDAVEAGFDDEFLEDLKSVQKDELAAFIRSLNETVIDNRNDRSFNDPGATDFGAPDTGNSSASITAIANTDAVIAIQLSQLAVLRSIDRKMDGGGGLTQVSPSTTLPATDGVDASLATRFERSLRSQGRV